MNRYFSVFALLLIWLSFSGCNNPASTKDEAHTLTVLAGSELKDMEPLLAQVEEATGISVKLSYSGTLDAVERLESGENVDAAWLASNRYAMLIPAVKARILASDRTMITPVVLGIKTSKAEELGWLNNQNVSWKDIADAAIQQKFTFGMTSPAASNTGFSGLLGLAAALSGKGDALEEQDIDAKRLSAFFNAQRLTSGSSGWLIEAFLKDQSKIDGLINYASSLALLNQNPDLREKMVLIYPKDGLLSSDYPFMLVNPAKREAYNTVIAYLRGKDFQQTMTQTTLRRPINPDVPSSDQAPQTIAELPFPAKLAVVDAILAAFDNHLRLPTDSTFVLDQSGSMSGERIEHLKTAMLGLTGADTSISGRFAKFRNRELIFVLPFSNLIGQLEAFDMGNQANSNTSTLQQIATRVQLLQADGGTALFEATRDAYIAAAKRRSMDNGKFYSIVVMTDGLSNVGISSDQFVEWYNQLPKAEQGIKIFPVLFGEADPEQLQLLADLTGGKLFDSRKTSLKNMFKEIRGYQ